MKTKSIPITQIASLLARALALPRAASAAGSPEQADAQAKVDLNAAGEAELITLPGVGPAKAAAIVKHREQRRFETVEDLLRVRGIGRKVFQRLRDRVTVGSEPAGKRKRSHKPAEGATQ
jgi:comEA protein